MFNKWASLPVCMRECVYVCVCVCARRDYLDTRGLAQLLKVVLPKLTEGEVYYFQVGW